MHEAYEIFHLLNATFQIESMAAYDNNLLLGTRQGHLLMYSLSMTNGNQKYELQLLRYCKTFSKKAIMQIEVIPEDNLLLCLTENGLSTHNINGVNFPLVKTFEQTKGASLFALDNKPTTSMSGESKSVVRLCVAIRRKLQLYQGINGEFKQHLYDYTMPDLPKVLAWGQQYLCAGFKSDYVLYDLSSGDPKELFPTSNLKKPTIAKYSETSYFLGRDQTSVLVEECKETKDENELKKKNKDFEIKKTIKWSEAPVAVVWDEPFVLGLLTDQVVVQTVEPTLFVQTLSELKQARFMYRCKRGLIFVCSMGQVWCLSSVDVTKQIQQLVKDKQFQVALQLTDLYPVPTKSPL